VEEGGSKDYKDCYCGDEVDDDDDDDDVHVDRLPDLLSFLPRLAVFLSHHCEL